MGRDVTATADEELSRLGACGGEVRTRERKCALLPNVHLRVLIGTRFEKFIYLEHLFSGLNSGYTT